MNLKSLLFFLGLTIGFWQTGFTAQDADARKKALEILKIEDKKENESIEEFKKRVQKAYLAQSKRYHPDKTLGDKNAAEIFKTLKPAYELLLNLQKINSSTNSPDDIIKGTFLRFLSQLIQNHEQTIFYLTSDQMPIDDISPEPDYITEEQAEHLQTTFMQDENALTVEKWMDDLLSYLQQENLLTLFFNDESTDTIITTLITLQDYDNLEKLLNYHNLNLNTPLKRLIQFPEQPALTTNLTPLALAICINASKEITSLLIEHKAEFGNIENIDKEILPLILTNLCLHGQHETLKTLLKSGMPSSLELFSILLLNSIVKQLQEKKKALEKELNTNNKKGSDKDSSLHDLLLFKIKNVQETINSILVKDQVKLLISEHGSAQEYFELLKLSVTPTKSTMLPISIAATAGCIIKDLFNFKTERTKKRKEKAEEKERQEKKELETSLMKQQMYINSVDAASSTEEESKETSDKKEKQAQKANRSPIKQLQHFMQKYGRDIKKNPRHHALLACTLIPWILHYGIWR